MKWFKHMSNSSRDEKLVRLTSEHGLEGYGFFWVILETIATNIDEKNQNFCEYPAKFWQNVTSLTPKKFKKLLKTCEILKIFEVKYDKDNPNLISITSPNILKYQDEWTKRRAKNSGVTQEQVKSCSRASLEENRIEEIRIDKSKSKREEKERARELKKSENPKQTFGENKKVFLTEEEYTHLCKKFTPSLTDKAVAFLDLHIGAKGKDEYKSHCLALQKWVFDAVKEREAKLARASPGGSAWKSPAQRRLEANQQAGREAKTILFGEQPREVAHGTG